MRRPSTRKALVLAYNHGMKGHTDKHAAEEYTFSEDFYAMAWLSYKKDVMEQCAVTPKMQGHYFYSALWIFMMELTLIVIILKVVVVDV